MTNLLRLLTRPVVPAAIVMLTLAAPAFADAELPVLTPDGYGAYLAGEQALKDLATNDAERYLRDSADAQWDEPAVVQRSFLADLANGDIDRAATTAQHLTDIAPNDTLAKLVLAAVDLKDRRYRAVDHMLGKLGTDDFAGITASVLRAWAFVGEGRRAAAFDVLDKLGKGGLDDFLLFHRALMADVSGDSPDAISLAGKAYAANPGVARMVEAYARILGNAGRFSQALDVVNKFDSQGLGDPLVSSVKRALQAHQRPGLFATNVQGGAAELFHGIALALARDGTNDLALGMLQLGLYLDPHNDVIRLLVGQLLDGADQHAAANAYYADVDQNSPLKVAAAVRIAQNYDAMGNRAEAIRQLTNLTNANPNDVDALTVLAGSLRVDKQYDKAAAAFSKAIDLEKGDRAGDWVLYYERGIAYEQGGHWDKAQPDFLKALALNPGQPQVLNYLGYTWVDKGQNLNEALGMIEKAVKATPTDGYIVDSLGWAFYKLGRYADAVNTLEEAAQLKPDDPQINDHLGDAYWKAGRKLEAHFQWNIAASLDPDSALLTAIRRKQADGLDPTTAAATPVTAPAAPAPATPSPAAKPALSATP